MIVGTLKKHGIGIDIPNFQIDANGSNDIRQDLSFDYFNRYFFHSVLQFGSKKKASTEAEALNIVWHNETLPMLRIFGNRSTTTSLYKS